MPAIKEINYFASDREMRHTVSMTRDEYLSIFAGAPAGVRIGEASVAYLRSTVAARAIADFSPSAQIIIMLRDPVEVMHALHSESVFLGVEDIGDFGEAVEAESDRRAGRRIPAAVNNPRALLYREAVSFSEQAKRYFDIFGPSRIHVVVFDDLRRDTARVVRETYAFLGVDETFIPNLEVANRAKIARSRLVQRLVASPPGWARRSARRLMGRPARKRLYRLVTRLNGRAAPRPAMDPELEQRLRQNLRPEIEKLGALIKRDLSHWLAPQAPVSAPQL